MRLVEALCELFLPAACASCRRAHALSGGLCGECALELGPSGPLAVPTMATARAPGLPPVVAAGPYEGALAEVLNEYKERGRRELAPALAGLLGRAVDLVAEEVPGAALVPVPPTRAARRERGFDHVASLCAPLGPTHRCLVARPRPDSVGLTAAQRRRAARSSLGVAPRRAASLAASGRPAILVDDIVTTGATLSAAAAVLRRSGVSVAAAVAVAAVR